MHVNERHKAVFGKQHAFSAHSLYHIQGLLLPFTRRKLTLLVTDVRDQEQYTQGIQRGSRGCAARQESI